MSNASNRIAIEITKRIESEIVKNFMPREVVTCFNEKGIENYAENLIESGKLTPSYFYIRETIYNVLYKYIKDMHVEITLDTYIPIKHREIYQNQKIQQSASKIISELLEEDSFFFSDYEEDKYYCCQKKNYRLSFIETKDLLSN